MLLLFWILLFLAGICLFLLMPSVLGVTIYDRYRGARIVTCPATQRHASVRIDAIHAAFTGMTATEKLRVDSCSLWPKHSGCDQDCLPDAIAAPKFVFPARRRTQRVTRRIHLPAFLVATAVFWLIGLFWYSQYLFRAWWMSLIGMSSAQLRQVVELWSPHLVTLGVAALFTLALACVMLLFDCRTCLAGDGRRIPVLAHPVGCDGWRDPLPPPSPRSDVAPWRLHTHCKCGCRRDSGWLEARCGHSLARSGRGDGQRANSTRL